MILKNNRSSDRLRKNSPGRRRGLFAVLIAAVVVYGLVGLLLALVPSQCNGSDWSVGGFITSEHYGAKGITNEDHTNSLYACYEWFCAGRYENSYSDHSNSSYSNFVGGRYLIADWHGVEFEAFAGIVDGYKGTWTDYQNVPYAGITARFSLVKLWQAGPVSLIGWELNSKDWREESQ